MEKNNIHFHYLTKPFYFPNRTIIKEFIKREIKKERRSIDTLNYIFCTDEYLLEINRSYLNHSTYTDIITFELSDKGSPLLSDIYISIDRVRENSKLYKTFFNTEILRVVFHGALHLCGFKDKTKKDSEIMKQKEQEFLKKFQKFHVKHFNK